MDDMALATIIASFFAAVASLGSVWMTVRQGKKVDETHKQVTVNHHSSDFPTVLDRIDDVKTLVLGYGGRMNDLANDFNDHKIHAFNLERRLVAVEDRQAA